MAEYRFKIAIVDAETDEVIESDFCTLVGEPDQFGHHEMVDMMTGKMLRNWRTFARAEHEESSRASQ